MWSKFTKKVRGSAIRNSVIDNSAVIEAGSSVVGSKMGRNSFCGYDCKLYNCTVGSFCSIADNVSVGLAPHPIEWVSTSPAFIGRKDSIKRKYARHEFKIEQHTKIGNDVWIGEGVYVKGGVSIGNGAVIGMGSVVTHDIPDYAIAAGNPARIIRMRFSEEQIKLLKELKWWEWEDREIEKFALYFNDINAFLAAVQKEGK